MNKKYAIIGGGGHARSITSLFEKTNNIIGFFDDNKKKIVQNISNLGTITGINKSHLIELGITDLIIAFGENSLRRLMFHKLIKLSNFSPLIHPKSILSKNAIIKDGSVIFAGSVVNPFAIINENCIINTSVIVEHNVVVGSHTNISPAAVILGNTEIGENCFIGANATIRENIQIGDNSIIGMGAVVTKNIPNNCLVMGNPAKIIKNINPNYVVFR